MKYCIPEISWHNRDPVLSVDFQTNCNGSEPLRLATGGTDTHVLIWHVSKSDKGLVNLDVAADLVRHQKAVNVVRWSPNGLYLASGDDESIIFIWKQRTDKDPVPTSEQSDEQYMETWIIHKTLRGHLEDVLDISWSPDSLKLASGSVDNKLMLWDTNRGRHTALIADHKGFVQGVAWDPLSQFVATCSTDRTFRTFDVNSKKVISRSSKAVLPFPSSHPLHKTSVRLYHDDTLQTFFRRLHISPDGLLIAVPAGKIEPEQNSKLESKQLNAVYIYTRYSLKIPACILPCGEAALAVRWSPVCYKPRPQGPAKVFPLAHRLVLAVATRRSVLFYDTQQKTPIAFVNNLHYTRLTDLTWSPDGRILIASSTDGFCSIITFKEGELGEVTPLEKGPLEISPQEQQTKSDIHKSEPFSKTPQGGMNKFVVPTEKSPQSNKIKGNVKTPIKIDVMEEVAMPSWSDNSSSDIIKPKESKEVTAMVLDESEDIKLVYDESQGLSKAEDNPESSVKSNTNSPIDKNEDETPFMKQAKVTDVSQAATHKVPGPDTPRRVSFITLSSPKNSKKKC